MGRVPRVTYRHDEYRMHPYDMTVRQAVSQGGFHFVQFFTHAASATALLSGTESDRHVHLRDGLHGGQRTTQLRFFALNIVENVARSENSGCGRKRLV